MSDDDHDLIRLFAEQDPPPASEAFTASVAARVAARRLRSRLAIAALAFLAIPLAWLFWPALQAFAANATAGIGLIAGGTDAFFQSVAGVVLVAALGFSIALWLWLNPRLAGR